MLEHADRRDGVELLAAELPVVLQPDVDQVVEPGGGHPLPRPRRLLAADRDAHDVGPGGRWAACIASEPQPQPTSRSRRPGASWRPSLRQMSSCLSAWASARLMVGRREPGARVRHRRAEHDVVELVADVVVVAHHLAVAAEGVAPATRPHLLGRRRERRADDAGEPSGLPRSWQRPRHEAHTSALDVVEGAEHGEEIAVHLRGRRPRRRARCRAASGDHRIRRTACGVTRSVPTGSTGPNALPSHASMRTGGGHP